MMQLKREPHPLQDQRVLLNDQASDPQRAMIYPGAKFRVREWYVNMDPDAIEPLIIARNWAEKWYIERAKTNNLPLTDLIYGYIGPGQGLGHIIHVSEIGEVVSDE